MGNDDGQNVNYTVSSLKRDGITKNIRLRAYPKSPDALNVIHAHAKCNNAR